MIAPPIGVGHARRAAAAVSRSRPFRGFVDLQPLLQARAGERVLIVGPGSRLDAALASWAVKPGGSAVPFEGSVPFPFPDERFDAALVTLPVGEPADAAVAVHEIFRVLVPGGRAILVGPVAAGERDIGDRVPTEATLRALLTHCGFTGPTLLARRRAPGDADARSQTVVVGVVRPR